MSINPTIVKGKNTLERIKIIIVFSNLRMTCIKHNVNCGVHVHVHVPSEIRMSSSTSSQAEKSSSSLSTTDIGFSLEFKAKLCSTPFLLALFSH